MEYIKMNASHITQVAELEAMCFSMPWSEKAIKNELTNPLSLWIVAVEGDIVAGYVGSQSVMGEADMMNLAVAPEFRRQGIAGNLVQELIRNLCDEKVSSLTLEVRQSNSAAIALYEKLGFIQVGCRPNYYANPKEAALILRKEWDV